MRRKGLIETSPGVYVPTRRTLRKMQEMRKKQAEERNTMAWIALLGFGVWGYLAWQKKKEQEAILGPQLKELGDDSGYGVPVPRPGYFSENYDPMLQYAQSAGLDPSAFMRD